MPRVPLANGKGFALVDAGDLARVRRLKWRLHPDGYAIANDPATGKTVRLHDYVTPGKTGDGRVIDHINGDKLDDRRSNLRVATKTENGQNRGAQANNKLGAKGVRKRPSGTYEANIQYGGKQHSLGSFPTKQAAEAAYRRAAEKHFGKWNRA